MRSVFSSKSFRTVVSLGFLPLLTLMVFATTIQAQVVFNAKINPKVQQVARNQAQVKVIFFLTDQPAYAISLQEKAIREAPLRNLETQLDQLIRPFGPEDIVPEPVRVAMDALNRQRKAIVDEMRAAIYSRTATRVQAQQARFRQFVEGQPNVQITSQVVDINSFGVDIPVNLLNRLAEHADVDSIILNTPIQLELNSSRLSVGANYFDAQGFTGSLWEVAVLDTGVNFNLSPSNGLPNSLRGPETHFAGANPLDNEGHGTAVAGIIASRGGQSPWNNQKGVAKGLNKIINAKIVNNAGGPAANMNTLNQALSWAIGQQSADAVNLSLNIGGAITNNAYSDEAAIVDYYSDVYSVPIVKSAGNSSSHQNITKPGDAYNVITVGNVNDRNTPSTSDDRRASTSMRNPVGATRRYLQLMAPGQSIVSSNETNNPPFIIQDNEDGHGGTSFAAPHVTGGLALLAHVMSIKPHALKAVLLNTATDQYNTGENNDSRGWDRDNGYGYLNLYRALYNRHYAIATISAGQSKYFTTNITSATNDLGKVTLVWNAHVDNLTELTPSVSNLDLYIYDYTSGLQGDLITSSVDSDDNVEQVLIDNTGRILIEVRGVTTQGSEEFTVASMYSLTTTSPAPAAVRFESTESDVITDELGNNFPNPFNPETWIPFSIAKDADVKISIYDLQGQLVRSLDLGHRGSGRYFTKEKAAHWDGRNDQGERVASGPYFYYLSAGDFKATRKLVIKK